MATTVYDILAWGFLAFTGLFTLVVLRLWWEENRDEARSKATPKISN
jgi:cbb3-type cytochrome oxidase subunit 3